VEILDKIAPLWSCSEAAKKLIPEFIELLGEGNPDIWKKTIEILNKIDPHWPSSKAAKKQIPEFIALLRDGEPDVRKEAIEILNKIDSDWHNSEAINKQIPEFIKTLKNRDVNTQKIAAEILIKVGSPAMEPLLKAMCDSKEPEVSRNMIKVLDGIDPNWPSSEIARKLIPRFIKMLNDRDLNFQRYIEGILVKMSKSSIRPFIAAMMDKDGDIRDVAEEVLNKIEPNWTTSTVAKKQVPKFIEALRVQDSNIRYKAINILNKIGDTIAIEPLCSIMWDKNNGENMRSEASKAIVNIIDSNQYYFENYPYLFCTECLLRSKKEIAKIGVLKSYSYVACRNCGSSLYLMKNIKQVVGLIGVDINTYKQDGEKVYVNLWFEAEKKARNADIDILEIHESNGVSYDYAVNAVLNVLKNDVSRPIKYVKRIPVIISGNPPLSENSMKILENEFGSVKYA